MGGDGGGQIVMSPEHGPQPKGRRMFHVSTEEMIELTRFQFRDRISVN